ncbi:MAG: hypothetical protein CME72_11520 [Halomonadaceae bacterium]|nr:hypothetical protein [Halomonadaceae bacterium]
MKIWGWLLAGLGFLSAALMLVMGQRDRAREKAKAAKVRFQASEATREVEKASRKAAQASRQQSAEVQREDDDRPDTKRPTGNLRR